MDFKSRRGLPVMRQLFTGYIGSRKEIALLSRDLAELGAMHTHL